MFKNPKSTLAIIRYKKGKTMADNRLGILPGQICTSLIFHLQIALFNTPVGKYNVEQRF